jgi:hypothetical protein
VLRCQSVGPATWAWVGRRHIWHPRPV